MKKKVTAVLVGILVIGLVSAGIVPWISNIVTGTVSVEGPVFYASGTHPLGGTDYWGLGINEYVERENPVSFTGSDPKFFISDKLGIDSFYAANYEISIEAESDNESGQIDARIYFIEGNNPYNRELDICSGSVGPVYNKNIYTINCNAEELTGIDPEWRLVLELSDGLNNIHYDIYIEGNTKIEVTAE